MKQEENKKHAFLFRGVGTECNNYLSLLEKEQKDMLIQYCRTVKKEIGLDLEGYLFNSQTGKFDKSFCDWIGIYTYDNLIYQVYRQYGIKPDILIGYSMGLITAMTCGKAISFESGLQMLQCTYEYPIGENRENEAMAVIIGLSYENVLEIITEVSLNEFVEIASENNKYCITIAGTKNGIKQAMDAATEAGAINVKDVNAPYAFHTKLAAKGIEKFEKLVSQVHVSDSELPIISSFDQKVMKNSSELKEELIRNMSTRMMWKSSIEKSFELGIESFVEVSMEDSITKFTKQIRRDLEFITYNKVVKGRK